jgi:peptide/nickel transport system permease protein
MLSSVGASAGRVAFQPLVARRWTHDFGRALRRSKSTRIGGAIVLVLVLVAIAAPLLAPHPAEEQDITRTLRPPFWYPNGSTTYLLGTDNLGGDILSRAIYGARISMGISVSAVSISVALGVLIGLTAGYAGGRVDDLLMGVTEIQLAFPMILLALAVISLLGPNITNLIIVLGITGWPWYARVLRGEILSIKEREFVLAARVVGCGVARVIFRHLLPQVSTSIIILVTLQLARMIIYEAALSFLGLGVQAPTPSWGSMLADGRNHLASSWWFATFPGLAISVATLGVNLLGDGLRDLFDPRLRE